MSKFICTGLMACLLTLTSFAQPDRWQQKVKYTMDIRMNVETNQFSGTQKLVYTNNSPDTLNRVFYHLYWNAFQPNSMMDTRSRELGKTQFTNGSRDWDSRVTDRISKLKEDEIGYQKIKSLKLNGVEQKFVYHETILEVILAKPILPKATVTFDMVFDAQVPLQVRRAGRDNPSTGVHLSMSQWYPKMVEYDYDGWHPNPYIAREFYGVWGDYDVKITIDKNYTVGGTGYLQNGDEIGKGYETAGKKVVNNKPQNTWHFIAPNVHDFMWAADPHYNHLSEKLKSGVTIHVLYDRDLDRLKNVYEKMSERQKANFKTFDDYLADYDAQWKRVLEAGVVGLPFVEKNFGAYPYKQYSFIHGGDGGMEYPMATLLSGPSIGTAFHELMHMWYQMMLGTDEAQYSWMDEGFTNYATTLVSRYYNDQTRKEVTQSEVSTGPRRQATQSPNMHQSAYNSYFSLAKSGLEEPLTTHADHFETNYAYSQASYAKGNVFLEQLGYIVGAKTRDAILLTYYDQWKFKHPNGKDFLRVAEKVSGIELDWYYEYFVNTTKTIDYGVEAITEENGQTKIELKRIGFMPMPIDLQVTYADGSKQNVYIPLYQMFGAKKPETDIPTIQAEAWKWTHPTYTVILPNNKKVAEVEIDPSQRLADIDRSNNVKKQ
jgi:hypothetical protein